MYRDNVENGMTILDIDDDESESDHEDDEPEDDEKRSISSECSIYFDEVKTDFQVRPKQLHQHSADLEIWRLFEVDRQSLKDIDDADTLLDLLTTTEIEGRYRAFLTCLILLCIFSQL